MRPTYWCAAWAPPALRRPQPQRARLCVAVEKCGYAGGNITNANVIGVCGATNMQTGYLVTGGITAEMLQRSAYLRDPVDMDKLTRCASWTSTTPSFTSPCRNRNSSSTPTPSP